MLLVIAEFWVLLKNAECCRNSRESLARHYVAPKQSLPNLSLLSKFRSTRAVLVDAGFTGHLAQFSADTFLHRHCPNK